MLYLDMLIAICDKFTRGRLCTATNAKRKDTNHGARCIKEIEDTLEGGGDMVMIQAISSFFGGSWQDKASNGKSVDKFAASALPSETQRHGYNVALVVVCRLWLLLGPSPPHPPS